jgi:hypothetical protein
MLLPAVVYLVILATLSALAFFLQLVRKLLKHYLHLLHAKMYLLFKVVISVI